MMTLNTTTSATNTLLSTASPIALYAGLLRNVAIALRDECEFFDGLVPDEANDDGNAKRIEDSLNAVASTLAGIALNCTLPDVHATVQNFRTFMDSPEIAARVEGLQKALNALLGLDVGTGEERQENAA